MQEMPRNQRHTLWGKLASLLQDVLQDLPPEQWDRGGPEGMEVQSAVDFVGLSNGVSMFYTIAHKSSRCYSQNRAVAVVDGVTLVAALSLKVLQDGDAYSGLLQAALMLHGWCPCRWMRGVYTVFEWFNGFFSPVSQIFSCPRLSEMHLCSTTFTTFARPGGKRT